MRPVYGPGETVVARVDAAGMVMLGDVLGPVVACIRGSEIFGDAYGSSVLGKVDGEGRVISSDHAVVGRVDASLAVSDALGNRIGRVIEPEDAGVLLLVVNADALRPTLAPETSSGTIMDEVYAVESMVKSPELRGRRGEF